MTKKKPRMKFFIRPGNIVGFWFKLMTTLMYLKGLPLKLVCSLFSGGSWNSGMKWLHPLAEVRTALLSVCWVLGSWYCAGELFHKEEWFQICCCMLVLGINVGDIGHSLWLENCLITICRVPLISDFYCGLIYLLWAICQGIHLQKRCKL